MTDMDWIREGARVAIARYSYSGDISYTTAAIAKLTKTQIVLDNQQRFNRQHLTLIGGSRYTAPTLKPLTDPAIVAANTTRQFSEVTRKVDDLAREHRNGRRKGEAEILAMLDEIEQAVRAARKAITGKEAQPLAGNPAVTDAVETWLASPRRPSGPVYASAQDLLARIDAALTGKEA